VHSNKPWNLAVSMSFEFNIAKSSSVGNCEMSLTTGYPRSGVRRAPLALMLVVECFVQLGGGPRDFEGGGNEL